jgi:hypothetical protein
MINLNDVRCSCGSEFVEFPEKLGEVKKAEEVKDELDQSYNKTVFRPGERVDEFRRP